MTFAVQINFDKLVSTKNFYFNGKTNTTINFYLRNLMKIKKI